MAEHTQKIESLTNKAIGGEVSPCSSEVDEMVLQCQIETKDQIEQLEARADDAKTVSEKMRWKIRVKALKVLMSRLEAVCGIEVTTAPTDAEVDWARTLFGLEK